jgi:hypothetical protein
MYVKKPFEQETLAGDDSQDRRTIKRRHLIYYLRVWKRPGGELVGHVVDITTQGMMLISEQQLPLNKRYDLEIRWRSPDGEKDQVIAFSAETMWASPDINASFYGPETAGRCGRRAETDRGIDPALRLSGLTGNRQRCLGTCERKQAEDGCPNGFHGAPRAIRAAVKSPSQEAKSPADAGLCRLGSAQSIWELR